MDTKRASSVATKLATKHYLGQIWREKRTALPGLILPGIGSIFGTYITPLIVAAVITRFDGTTPTLQDAVPYLLLFAGAWLLGEIIWRIAFIFLVRAETKIMGNLYKTALFELSKKDIGFFHDNFAGSLTKKAAGYGRSFETFMDALTFNIVANLLPLIFASVILWRYSPIFVFVLLGMMSLVVVLILPLIRRRKQLVDAREIATNTMVGHVADVIGNMDAVQAYAHTNYEQARHKVNVDDAMAKAKRSWDYSTLRIDSTISPLYVLINVIGLAVAITLSNDATTIATVFVVFSYFSSATRILWEFNRTYRNIENSLAEAAQFTELLLSPPAITEADRPIKLHIPRGEISFEHVDFAYDTHENDPLFKDFTLRIASGEKLALVGHSGGGKTTVTKLLLRFNDVTGGALRIDGQNIAEGTLADLRKAIAYVPQEPVMFHRSIRENIRYGKLDASDQQVVEAATKANAHEFIKKLPQGYDTLVGERGVKLSGGQRQRIAIARAIIKDAPILVLDEATSALDSESEKLIQAALWKLMQGRTALVIAHRLSTIQKMDRIVVLDNGSIAEQGTHAELLKQNGTYARLWKHQSGGFIEE